MKKYHILLSIILFIATLYVARISYLQLFSDNYLLNGFNTSVKTEFTPAQRGAIFDRNGILLVGNSPNYEMVVIKDLIEENFDTLAFCKLLDISKEEFKLRLQIMSRQPLFKPNVPGVFMKNISPENAATYMERLYKFKAFKIQDNPDRSYKIDYAGNVLGYINEVSPSDIKKDSLYYINGDKIGKAGVEKSYEDYLRGQKGIHLVQKDILLKTIGSYKDGMYDKQMKSGSDLTLTIDSELQELAEYLLQNKRGSIVALDPQTGEILCLASSPSYSPKEVSGEYKQENLYRLLNDSFQKPMYDRALQAAYPPGSTFKLLTGLAALQMGVIDTGTAFSCRYGFRVGNRWVKCHDGGVFKIEPAIQLSCNTFFSKTYMKIISKDSTDYNVGLNEWSEIMHSFGLGEYFGNDLPVGSMGKIPNSDYYLKYRGKDYVRPTTVFSNGIGQGEVLLTPLQMANFTAAIANKGYYYTPHIVKAIDGEPITDKKFTEKHITKVDPKYFKFIWNGMQRVIRGGTARKIYTREFSQMGKTGTAQNPNKDHALFVLAAPADKPRIVVAAIVENGGFGATNAAPMASLIAEKYILGEVKRQSLAQSVSRQSINAEYRRQWISYLKKEGKWIDYIDPHQLDSLNLDPVNVLMIKEAMRQREMELKRQKLKDSLSKINKNKKDSLKR